MEKLNSKTINKFNSLIRKTNKCWLWIGCKDKDGYGRKGIKKKTFKAHRIAYFLHYGILPDDKLVCHSCDNPSCVNPKHLFLGDWNDNVQDMMKKGRYVQGGKPHPGEKNGRALMKEKEVREIYSKYKKKPYSELAKEYGVTKSCIQNIMLKKSWKHLNLNRK